jgi:5-deoxy-D-glucuronate isomerase
MMTRAELVLAYCIKVAGIRQSQFDRISLMVSNGQLTSACRDDAEIALCKARTEVELARLDVAEEQKK